MVKLLLGLEMTVPQSFQERDNVRLIAASEQGQDFDRPTGDR